jgi:hypothetical protein
MNELPSVKELVDLVAELNSEILEKTGKEYIHIVYKTDGFIDEISLEGLELWNSETDDRPYIDEEKDIKEDIETHIRCVLEDELSALSSIVFDRSAVYYDVNTNRPLNSDIINAKPFRDRRDIDDPIAFDDLVVQYKTSNYTLNGPLALSKGLTGKQVRRIRDLHIEKLRMFEQMEKTSAVDELRTHANAIEAIEYELQNLWGFDKDKRYHEWYMVPKCTCPKMDNRERRGTDYQIITLTCPLHGDSNDH